MNDTGNNIKIKKKGKWWIASYITLDVVTQGYTKKEALLNLLECITIEIDHAIKHGNLKFKKR